MRTIYKYPLKLQHEQIIEINELQFFGCDGSMPPDNQVLMVDVQNGVPCIWCEVDTEKPKSPVQVFICGTGTNADHIKDAFHVGSFMLNGGSFVGHVYMSEICIKQKEGTE